MNEMLYDIIDGQEVFVGFCYTHQGRRVLIEGEEGCQHDTCLAYRDMPESTAPYFNVERLKQQNAIGQTANEIRKEIQETADREGREIERAR